MNYLTTEQTLFIHSVLVHETGGAHGIRDLGLLESAVARPQATFDGIDLHAGLFKKAAALFHGLIKNHPFVDGNKRTGAAAAGLFLRLNGYRLFASNEDLEDFAIKIANSMLELGEIAEWLQHHSDGVPHGK